jgi:hypothetical protein
MVSSPAFVLSKVKLVASIGFKMRMVQLYRDLLNILLLFQLLFCHVLCFRLTKYSRYVCSTRLFTVLPSLEWERL